MSFFHFSDKLHIHLITGAVQDGNGPTVRFIRPTLGKGIRGNKTAFLTFQMK